MEIFRWLSFCCTVHTLHTHVDEKYVSHRAKYNNWVLVIEYCLIYVCVRVWSGCVLRVNIEKSYGDSRKKIFCEI